MPNANCLRRWLPVLALILASAHASAFDHSHANWTSALQAHVEWNAAGTASTVDYTRWRSDRAALDRYLASLSALPREAFDGWSVAQRRGFLINAYNAWTVDLILRSDPDLESIRDLGSLFSSPWKRKFFELFGQEESLDGIEHDLLRGAPDYDDPRIHFAVNCASIGCPALRPEAYRADDLDAQLEDQTRRFLRDGSRNRWDAKASTLYLSKIFDWYAKDFDLRFRGGQSRAQFLARYAAELGFSAAEVERLAADEIEVDLLDYDWALNRAAR